MPPLPPLSVTVYVVDGASAFVGCRVTALPLAVTVAGTTALEASLSWNVLVVTELEARVLLNWAVTAVVARTPVAPAAGEIDVTVGGVVSVWLKTTSTQ